MKDQRDRVNMMIGVTELTYEEARDLQRQLMDLHSTVHRLSSESSETKIWAWLDDADILGLVNELNERISDIERDPAEYGEVDAVARHIEQRTAQTREITGSPTSVDPKYNVAWGETLLPNVTPEPTPAEAGIIAAQEEAVNPNWTPLHQLEAGVQSDLSQLEFPEAYELNMAISQLHETLAALDIPSVREYVLGQDGEWELRTRAVLEHISELNWPFESISYLYTKQH